MKSKLKKITAALLASLFIFSPNVDSFASNFRDVGSNLHWAQNAINEVSNLGILTGDLSGNFNPSANIDKFETVRIFARMFGFNPSSLTPAQVAYHNMVYQQRSALISNASSNFNRWNSSVNREIAYLLYRGVLLPSDLNNFISIQGNTEQLRVLTREEVAVFLVRFMGREQQAFANTNFSMFIDDSQISPSARPHIYFLRTLGIMNGSENRVNPRNAVTRAELAVLIHSTLREANSTLLGGNQTSPNLEQISGNIAQIFAPSRSIQTTSSNLTHNNRILFISNNAIITINGINSSFADLAAGMSFTGSIGNNGEIVSVSAQSNIPNNQGNNNQNVAPNAPNPNNIRVLHGAVYRINAGNNTIGIEIRMLNIAGEIITEIQDFTIAQNAVINRDGNNSNISLPSISVGELAVVQIYNNMAINIQLEQRIRDITGILIEKDFSSSSLFPTFVVRDDLGNNHRISTDANSTITRHGQTNLLPRQIRIGDRVTLRSEYGRLVNATAAGNNTTADVYIRSIFTSSREQSHIIVAETQTAAAERRHLVVDGAFDMSLLRIGTRVRLVLESDEVTNVVVLPQLHATNFTGHLLSRTESQITVRDDNFIQRNFYVDSNTIIISSITGNTMQLLNIPINARMNVSSTAANPSRANVITILTH